MFERYTIETAPENSKELLQNVFNKFGFVPNQDKILAVSPSIYQAYNQSFDLFLGKSTLELLEGQIVLMTISFENNSSYCMALHSWGMEMTKVPTDLYEWMHNRCGLVNNNNPCRCPKKTKGFIEKGYVNPQNLKWHSDFSNRIYELSESAVDHLLNERDKIYSNLFQQHPFKNSTITTEKILNEILNNDTFSQSFDLN